MSLLDLGLEIQEEIIVPPKGLPSAKLAFVGEAPGSDEIRQLQPFVGRSGSLFQKLLFQAGISFSEIYVTNVVKIKPPKPGTFFNAKKGEYTPEGLKWIDILKTELENTEATVIIAMGKAALVAVCGKKEILKWRGSILKSTLLPGRKVIPIIHPSSALKTYIRRYYITTDLFRAKNESAFPEVRRPERNLITNITCDEAISFLDAHKDEKRICLDIEISGQLEISCIGFAFKASEAICIPIQKFSIDDETRIWKRIAVILEDPEIMLIGQNIMFDLYFILYRYGIVPQGFIGDTMIAHNIMYPDFNKGLDFLCSVYTDEPYYKGEGKEWKIVRDWEMFWRYNCKDAATTLEIWDILELRLKENGYWPTYERTERLHYPCLFMMYHGFRADPEGVRETKELIQKDITETQILVDEIIHKKAPSIKQSRVDSHTGQTGYLNVNSPAQMRNYFYVELGIAPFHNKGKVTCDDKALQRLSKGTQTRKPLLEASLIQKLIGLRKFRGTYLDMEIDNDNRFRCTYNPRGTIFGRLSSSQTIFHTGTNAQNLDPRFKGFLQADPGHFLAELDKVQAEWVATAYISGDPRMIAVVESGKDPHASTAELLTRIPIEVIMAEHKILKHDSNPDIILQKRKALAEEFPEIKAGYERATFLPRVMSVRQCGKKSNHGFNYGLGPSKFALQNEIEDSEAKLMYQGYHRAYPGIRFYYNKVEQQLNKNRILTNPYGRKIRLLGMYGDDLFKQGYSFNPQSTVGDMTNDGMWKTYWDDSLPEVQLKAQTHDSITVQLPFSAGVKRNFEILQRIKLHLEPELEWEGRKFKIATDIKIGLDWGGGMKELSFEKPEEISETIEELRRQDESR